MQHVSDSQTHSPERSIRRQDGGFWGSMNRPQLEDAIRAPGAAAHQDDLIIICSQAVHGQQPFEK